MGINLYCASCGKRGLLTFHRQTGQYGWWRSCICENYMMVVPVVEPPSNAETLKDLVRPALERAINKMVVEKRSK